MSLSRNIKSVLLVLNKAIQQTPLDKQPFLSQKISLVVNKYTSPNQPSNEAGFLKELQFNLNFIRLSFPHLDYSEPKVVPPQPQLDPEQERAREQFFEMENREQVQKFLKETQQAIKGVREEVEFSNWGAGNVDPEDLKRHKELLQRQYFGGQYWKGKEKPMSPTSNYLLNLMEHDPPTERVQVKDQEEVKFDHDPEQNWEKVKR